MRNKLAIAGLITVLVSSALAGGSSKKESRLSLIKVGMTKPEVVKVLGKPKSSRVIKHVEILHYAEDMGSPDKETRKLIKDLGGRGAWRVTAYYYVRIVDGKVESYGAESQDTPYFEVDPPRSIAREDILITERGRIGWETATWEEPSATEYRLAKEMSLMYGPTSRLPFLVRASAPSAVEQCPIVILSLREEGDWTDLTGTNWYSRYVAVLVCYVQNGERGVASRLIAGVSTQSVEVPIIVFGKPHPPPQPDFIPVQLAASDQLPDENHPVVGFLFRTSLRSVGLPDGSKLARSRTLYLALRSETAAFDVKGKGRIAFALFSSGEQQHAETRIVHRMVPASDIIEVPVDFESSN